MDAATLLAAQQQQAALAQQQQQAVLLQHQQLQALAQQQQLQAAHHMQAQAVQVQAAFQAQQAALQQAALQQQQASAGLSGVGLEAGQQQPAPPPDPATGVTAQQPVPPPPLTSPPAPFPPMQTPGLQDTLGLGALGMTSMGMMGVQAQAPVQINWTTDTFIATYQLNKEALDVLYSLDEETQQTVMRQFRPKTAAPGSYEMNGKFIMFARSVQRGQKGKKGCWNGGGKGCWDGSWNQGGDWGKGGCGCGCCGGGGPDGCAGGEWGPAGCGPAACGDWGKGGDWNSMGGKGGENWAGDGSWDNGKGAGPMGGPMGDQTNGQMGSSFLPGLPPTPEDIQEFSSRWGLNDDAHKVLMDLSPDIQANVMQQFKGGEPGSVNGRFIVFARGVQKGRKGCSKGYGKDFGSKDNRWAPY